MAVAASLPARYAGRAEKSGFVPVPTAIARDAALSDGAFRTYCVIRSYCYGQKTHCWPSMRTLAAHRGCSEETIRRHVRELEAAGLIAVLKSGRRNVYMLPGAALPAGEGVASQRPGEPPVRTGPACRRPEPAIEPADTCADGSPPRPAQPAGTRADGPCPAPLRPAGAAVDGGRPERLPRPQHAGEACWPGASGVPASGAAAPEYSARAAISMFPPAGSDCAVPGNLSPSGGILSSPHTDDGGARQIAHTRPAGAPRKHHKNSRQELEQGCKESTPPAGDVSAYSDRGEEKAAVGRLVAWGVSPAQARRLVKRHGSPLCEQAMELLATYLRQGARIRNPGGWLYCAITQGYLAPWDVRPASRSEVACEGGAVLRVDAHAGADSLAWGYREGGCAQVQGAGEGYAGGREYAPGEGCGESEEEAGAWTCTAGEKAGACKAYERAGVEEMAARRQAALAARGVTPELDGIWRKIVAELRAQGRWEPVLAMSYLCRAGEKGYVVECLVPALAGRLRAKEAAVRDAASRWLGEAVVVVAG